MEGFLIIVSLLFALGAVVWLCSDEDELEEECDTRGCCNPQHDQDCCNRPHSIKVLAAKKRLAIPRRTRMEDIRADMNDGFGLEDLLLAMVIIDAVTGEQRPATEEERLTMREGIQSDLQLEVQDLIAQPLPGPEDLPEPESQTEERYSSSDDQYDDSGADYSSGDSGGDSDSGGDD